MKADGTARDKANEKKAVVALLLGSYGAYQQEIATGVRSVLAEAGFGTLCIAGRELKAQRSSYAPAYAGANSIYKAARAFDVRGFISMSTALGYNVSSQELGRFIDNFSHLPVVSIGAVPQAIPSVTVDNKVGMSALMQHLTSQPYQRFAFMRGFANNGDSLEREAIFRQALEDAGLALDPDLVLEGGFLAADAFAAMDELLTRRRDFDVVVAANDYMAFGIINALNKHGLDVPFDIAVAGFDDVRDSAVVTPPLTTVRQPLAAQGEAAAKQMLTLLNGRPAEQVAIGTELVVRRSCGSAQDSTALLSASKPGKQALSVAALHAQLGPAPAGTDLAALLEAFDKALDGADQAFFKCWQTQLRQSVKQPADLNHWRALLAALETGQTNASQQLTHLLLRAQTLSTEFLHALQTQQLFEAKRQDDLQGRMHLLYTAATRLETLFDTVHASLSERGVRRCFIALYEPCNGRESYEVQLRLAFKDKTTLLASAAEDRFLAAELLPARLKAELEQGCLLLQPLYVAEEQYGFILIDPDGLDSFQFEALAHSLSSAIRNSVQLEALHAHTAQLENVNRELAQLANYDVLTGLPNRTLFKARLEQAFTEANDEARGVALLFLDLDGFKYVNDTLGHSAGDGLLTLVARRLEHGLKPGDTVARLGGDEFTVILKNVPDASVAVRVAETILASLAHPFKLAGRDVHVTTSIGITHYPEDGADAETLLKHADTAMYHAKTSGKNRYHFYTAALTAAALKTRQLEQDLRRALANGELEMHYQPRFDLAEGQLTGFEALMRWQRGAETISPAVFIPLAEQSGLINELGQFALTTACRQAKCWHNAGQAVRVAVNLSVRQLQQKAIVAEVATALTEVGLDPAWLELEVTESAAMTDVEENIKKLNALRDLGVRIAIDDFGTAYSSLNYLKRLPVSSLKIDKGFLADVDSADGSDSADAAIVRAVVALGKSMGFRLVAEGVETAVQLDFLRLLGCDEAQGFLLGRPVPASKAGTLLASLKDPHTVIVPAVSTEHSEQLLN